MKIAILGGGSWGTGLAIVLSRSRGAHEISVWVHDAALAEFNIAAATGRLIAPAMKLPVQLYDMERHYKAVKDKWAGFGGGLKE